VHRTKHEVAPPLTPRPWRRQLQEERKVRQQKEQYAALARQINQYPPREETQTEIQALSAELVPPACPLKDVPPFPPASPAPRLAPPPARQ
jgi:transposase-like protein